jgi:thiol-disulfide isomerase/thioredoxin
MRTILFAALTGVLPLLAPAQDRKFIIDGKINSDTICTGKIYLAYNDNGEEMRDSSAFVNNTYHFQGIMKDGAIQANLTWEDRAKGIRFKGFLQFYAGPDRVMVVSNGQLSKAEITGSAIQQDAEMMEKQRRGSNRSEKERQVDYIKSHPDSWLSYVYLSTFFTRTYDLTLDETDSLYAGFSPALKKYHAVSEFKKLIDGRRTAVVGRPAIEFTEKDIDGRLVTLSSYRGKYVLIDFWASWCHPCRAENPNVTAAYHKFKDKGLNILSVSLDGGREAWLKAVKQDKLEWTQVSNLKAFDDEVVVKYGIHSIPRNFLIDPTGKIVAMDLRGPELEEKLGEIFK